MRAEIAELAEAGAADVGPLFEGGSIRWPDKPLKRGDGTVISYHSIDVHSLLAWLDRDRLIAQLDVEIEAHGR